MSYSRLLVVGGGRGQLHLYEAAKELDLPTTMLDSRPNVLATRLADQVVQTRPEDFSLAGDHLDETLIISDQSDFAQDWVFRFQKELQQPIGMSAHLTATGSDKARLRAHLDSTELNWLNPKWIVASKETLPRVCDKVPFDKGQAIVMKPLNEQGSAGVKFGEFQDIATLEKMLNRESGVRIFEERLSGPQISVDSISVGGNHAVVAVGTKQKFRKMPALDETIVFEPTHFSPLVMEAQKQLVKELGIEQGFLHSEYALTPKGVRLIEFGLRGGGGGISSHVAPYLTNSSMTRDFLAHRSRLEELAPPKIVPERRALVRFYTSLDQWVQARRRLATLGSRGIQLLCRLETDFTDKDGSSCAPRKAVIVVGCDSEDDLFVLGEHLAAR